MKTMAILGILMLLATAAVAKTPAPAQVDGYASGCATTVVQIKGLMDNFAPTPVDPPPTPSPALAAFLSSLHPVGYDVDRPNTHFGDSFRLCVCKVCTAKLEIRVKKTTQRDNPSNDDVIVGIAPFTPGLRIVDGHIWTNDNPEPPKTLTYVLDPGKLSELLCKNQKGPNYWLDVYIEDDTVVDWMRLTVTHP